MRRASAGESRARRAAANESSTAIAPHFAARRPPMDFLRDVANTVERAVTGASPRALDLPQCDVAFVSETIAEYGRILARSKDVVVRDADRATDAEVRRARFNMVWALCHSGVEDQLRRGTQMLERGASNGANAETTTLEARWRVEFGDAMEVRDGHYLRSVAYYGMKDYERAREAAFAALKCDPECRQAAALREASEEALARDGLVGAGAIAAAGLAILGATAAIAANSAGGSRR